MRAVFFSVSFVFMVYSLYSLSCRRTIFSDTLICNNRFYELFNLYERDKVLPLMCKFKVLGVKLILKLCISIA